jgi:metallo-beta-lactamase family protein
MVPWLVEQGFAGPVLVHRATADIAPINWRDSLHFGSPYSNRAVARAVRLLQRCSYNQPQQIGDCTAELFDAGHILGSSHVALQIGGKHILFSGDIGPRATPILRNPNTKWEQPFDTAVIESTYGDRIHPERFVTVQRLCTEIKRVVENRGILLIPAFAIGRTQEIVYHINTLVEGGEIPPLPVFIDSPMAEKITDIYARHSECYDTVTAMQIARGDLPLEFAGLNIVEDVRESRNLYQSPVRPMIIIAGSGMCTGGRIVHHLQRFLPHRNTTVLLVGWQAPGTPGYALQQKHRQIILDGERIANNARTVSIHGLSAHAGADQLLEWAQNIPMCNKRWLVNHGEPEASALLAQRLEKAGLGRAEAVKRGRVYHVAQALG